MGTRDLRNQRVQRVVAAGRRIADREDILGRDARAALATSSSLSPQGIELALTEHLELTPSAADIQRLLTRTGRAPRCHVVLAANVCTAALRAIAVAVATAEGSSSAPPDAIPSSRRCSCVRWTTTPNSSTPAGTLS